MSTLLVSRRLFVLVIPCVLGALLAQTQPALAATCTVTSTANAGPGTLRQCLLNAGAGDFITFDPAVFPPGAPATITLTDPLPAITAGGVTVNAANAGVVLDGASIDEANTDGLLLASSNNAIYGLHFHHFTASGVHIQAGANNNVIGGALAGQRNIIDQSGNGGIRILGSGNQVSGNWIGTEDGVTLPGVAGNAGNGVELAAGAQRNIIGGDQPGQGNVIVGSLLTGVQLSDAGTNGNTVRGNMIGVGADGQTMLANQLDGVAIDSGAASNTVGGANPTVGAGCTGACNVISGNRRTGVILVNANDNIVAGNHIGIDRNGTRLLGNQENGIGIYSGQNNRIGGASSGERNYITGNLEDGIRIREAGSAFNTVAGNVIGLDVNGTLDIRVLTLALAPGYGTTSNTLWAGTQDHGVWRSLDGGATWSAVNTGLTNLHVNAMGAANDGALFVGTTDGGIFRSTNDGGSWTQVGAGVTDWDILSIATSPNYLADGTVFVGTWFGVLVSTDRGSSWTHHAIDDYGIVDLAVAPTAPLMVFAAATEGQVFRSSDAGANWTNITGGWNYGEATAVALSPNFLADHTVFVGTRWGDECGRLFKSTDSGGAWTPVNHGGWCEIRDVALSPGYPADPQIFVGSHWSGVLHTTDNGTTWHQVMDRQQVLAVALSPAYTTDRVLFATSMADGIFKSLDGGESWTQLDQLTQLGNSYNGVSVGDGAHDNTIGGTTAGAGNLVSNNGWDGISIEGAHHTAVYGNWVGTDPTGSATQGNGREGIRLGNGAQFNLLGGADASQRNLISGNLDHGVALYDAGTMSNIVAGNYIGADTSGSANLGNANVGVEIWFGPSQNLVGGANATPGASCTGACNLIVGSRLSGVRIAQAVSNTVSGNYIGTDVAGTNSLPNDLGIAIAYGALGNTIGGVTSSERNLISGNLQVGVVIDGAGTANNVVAGNFVGVNASGSAALGNARFGMLLAAGTAQNRIGGSNATPGSGCSGACNLISGNANTGVSVSQAFSNTFSGNYIGTNLQGTQALPNASGVILYGGAANNIIGGATPGERNLVSGNRFDGIGLFQSGTTANTVLGNDVGVVADGTAGLGNNSSGIAIGLSASGNRIGGTAPGEDNVIAYNAVNGVTVEGVTTLSNTITHNSIHHNVRLGIDLTNGGNAELAAPVIITATNSGRVVGTACANCTVEVFSDAAGQGRVFEGGAVANAAGQFTFQAAGLLTGPQLTATATDASGNTSEFSQPFALPAQISHVYLPVVRK